MPSTLSTLVPWDGYKDFPRRSSQNDNRFGGEIYHTSVQNDLDNCCCKCENFKIEVLDLRQGGGISLAEMQDITTTESLENLLKSQPDCAALKERFFLLPPEYEITHSVSCLNIPKDELCKIFTSYKTMPSIVDCIRIHSESNDHRLGYGAYHQKLQGNGVLAECGYNLAYVVPNNRDTKFSVRHMTVYHKIHASDTMPDIWIIAKPPKDLSQRVTVVHEDSSYGLPETEAPQKSPLGTHIIALSYAVQNLREYYDYRFAKCKELTERAISYTVASQIKQNNASQGQLPGIDQELNVDFHIVQAIQSLLEELQRDLAYLGDNAIVVKKLKNLNMKVGSDGPARLGQEDALNDIYDTLKEHIRNWERMSEIVHGRLRLMYEVLKAQVQEQIAQKSELSLGINRLARKDTEKNRELTQATVRDAIGVKGITFIALMYLPCTFVATFLDCGILEFKTTVAGLDLKHNINTSKESMALFWILTIALTLTTYLLWHFWNKREIEVHEKTYGVSS